MKIRFLLIFLLFSCEKYSDYTTDEIGRVTITPIETRVSDAKIISWKNKSDLISKGIELSLQIPLLRKNDLKDLSSSKKIDAWLLRIFKEQDKRELLAQLAIPLHETIKQLKNLTIKILYSAAITQSPSIIPCPPMNHRQQIGDIQIKTEINKQLIITVNRFERGETTEIVLPLKEDIITVDGGEKLAGTYSLDLALYNMRTKIRYSNIMTYAETVKVKKEQAVFVKGCTNYEIPQ